MTLTRRAFVTVFMAGGVAAGLPAGAAVRVPAGGALRLPLPAPRRVLDPARAVDAADVWALALVHDTLATPLAGGGTSYPLLATPPVLDRADPRVATVTLRPGLVLSSGVAVDARAVVAGWMASRRASALAEMVFAMCDTAAPFEARSEREIRVRLAAPALLDEVLAASPLSVTGARGAGIGPFVPRGGDPSGLAHNPRCPMGAPYLDRVDLVPARERNEELRAFVTGALDGSWRGHALYDVDRPAEVVRGAPAGVVGMVPTPGGSLDDTAHARALERALGPLSAGPDAPLAAVDFGGPGVGGRDGDVAALAGAVPRVRVAREPADGLLAVVAERVVALLDAVGIRVALVGMGEPADTVLRAIAPLGADGALAVAAFMAVAGNPAGASAAARTPRGARAAVVAGAWQGLTAAVLGRAVPALHLRAGVRDARFDAAGRLLLGDAWVARVRA